MLKVLDVYTPQENSKVNRKLARSTPLKVLAAKKGRKFARTDSGCEWGDNSLGASARIHFQCKQLFREFSALVALISAPLLAMISEVSALLAYLCALICAN